MHRPFVEPLEIVRGIIQLSAPVEAKPTNVFLDSVDILDLLLHWVSIVKAQMATPTKLRCDTKIKTN